MAAATSVRRAQEMAEILQKLSLNADKNQTLEELLAFLRGASSSDVSALLTDSGPSLLSPVSLTSGIDSAPIKTASDADQIDLVNRIYTLALDKVPFPQLVQSFQAELIATIGSEQPVFVRTLLLKILDGLTNRESQSTQLPMPLVIAITRLLGQKSLGVYQQCQDILVKVISSQPDCLTSQAGSPLQQEMASLQKSRNDEIKFRFYELIGALCKNSDAALAACAERGYLKDSLKILKGTDTLAKLNILEILGDLASESTSTARMMEKEGFFQQLHEEIGNCQNSPDGSFLFPAVIRFFGYLGRQYPTELIDKYPLFLESVFQLVRNFHCLDVSQRLLGFDTLALIGSTPPGKNVLGQKRHEMKEALAAFGVAVKSGPMEVRTRHIAALAQLFQLKREEQTEELLELCRTWFSHMSDGKAFDLFFEMFKQPFPEVRGATTDLFCNIATQSWAQREMAAAPGFLEYLLDRGTEKEMLGRHMKYDLVKVLIESDSASQIFDGPSWVKLNQYYREGAFYIKAQLDVALEEA